MLWFNVRKKDIREFFPQVTSCFGLGGGEGAGMLAIFLSDGNCAPCQNSPHTEHYREGGGAFWSEKELSIPGWLGDDVT